MHFISTHAMRDLVNRIGPDRLIADMIDTLESDFRRWESFERAPRIASHSPVGVIELMPTSDGETYSFKYVNGHPGNPARGLQTVTAFGVLADVATGYPVLLAEMTLLTALRTAATSGLATRWLARPDVTTMGMIGAGSQAEFQVLAARAVRPDLRTVRIFDTDRAAAERTAANLAPFGLTVSVEPTAAAAVAHADVITTCTADKSNAVVLEARDVSAGTHVNAIGGDCPGKTELEVALVRDNPVFVEHTPQTRIEGEIQRLPADAPVTELWAVITGTAAGRTDSTTVTVFDSVGFAIEDFSALHHIRRAADTHHSSVPLDLIAYPDDPKDLFGTLDAPVPIG